MCIVYLLGALYLNSKITVAGFEYQETTSPSADDVTSKRFTTDDRTVSSDWGVTTTGIPSHRGELRNADVYLYITVHLQKTK